MRRLVEATLALGTVAAVAMLYMHTSSGVSGGRAVIDRPGAVVELNGSSTRAMAFYEQDKGALRLTVHFYGRTGSRDHLFRTSVRLNDKQRYSIEVEADDEKKGERYQFVRLGDRVELQVQSPKREEFTAGVTK